MNARPPTSLLLKGFGLLGIVPAILSSPSASEAQDGQEVRYQNPIVFARTHLDAAGAVTRQSKLWVMEDDGSGLRQITFGATYDDHPSFYADQRHVLYSEFPNNVLDRGDGARLVSLDIYTGEREIVHEVAGHALHHSSVSPLGDDLIVYARDSEERRSEWLGLPPYDRELPTVASNGVAVSRESVIFMHEPRGSSPRRVALVRIDGTGQGAQMTFLTDMEALHRRPAISPDGSWLAWQTNGFSAEDEVYLAELDGSNPRNLTSSPGNDGHPWFSRDGAWIVFESDRTGEDLRRNGCDARRHCEIWKVHVATGETVQLTHGGDRYASTRPRM